MTGVSGGYESSRTGRFKFTPDPRGGLNTEEDPLLEDLESLSGDPLAVALGKSFVMAEANLASYKASLGAEYNIVDGVCKMGSVAVNKRLSALIGGSFRLIGIYYSAESHGFYNIQAVNGMQELILSFKAFGDSSIIKVPTLMICNVRIRAKGSTVVEWIGAGRKLYKTIDQYEATQGGFDPAMVFEDDMGVISYSIETGDYSAFRDSVVTMVGLLR